MAKDRFSLKDRIALVIGGTSGIGRQIALGFADAGAVVLPASRTPEKVDLAVKDIQGAGGQAQGYVADARDVSQLRELVSNVVDNHGRIDILVNSQGLTVIKPAEEFTEEDYYLVLDTNLKSVFFCCTEVGKRKIRRGSGSIINIASIAGFRGWGNSPLYSMSKWGVVSLTQTLGRDWAEKGVRVNAIAPGFFFTELTRKNVTPQRKKAVLDRTPINRFGELEELTGAAIFLASDAASYVTGETLCVDGGFLAMGI